MELKELSQKIKLLRQDKRYDEVLKLYKSQIHGIYNNELIKADTWLVYSIMFCLRKTDKAFAALDFFNSTMKLSLNAGTPKHLLQEFGWSLFKMAELKSSGSESHIISENILRVERFLDLISLDSEYLLYTKLYFLSNELELKKSNPQLLVVKKRLMKFEPSRFSADCSKIAIQSKGQMREVELASDREKYYVLYSKLLFSLEEYNECIGICNEALETIPKFHFGNNLWLTRRLALCYTNIGNLEIAISNFKEILRKKSDWFIENELSMLLYQKGDVKKAQELGCKAALNGGFSEYKVNMFVQLGKILRNPENSALVCKHFALSIAIRNENQWKIPKDMESLLDSSRCEIAEKSSRVLYNELKKEWEGLLPDRRNEQELKEGYGIVTAILHDGSNGDGFITDEDSGSIYFRYPIVKGNTSCLKKGTKVWFSAKKREFKNKFVWNAITVKYA